MNGYLETALEIGRRLVDEAIWHEGRCNWVGASPEEGPGGALLITYAALGPDLYGGTSGIGLFLAELYCATGEDRLRRTALGALRQALGSVEELPPDARPALYAGGLGVALAFALAAIGLGEEDFLAAAGRLTRVRPLPDAERDLMSGDAGAVVALLALAELLDDQRAKELAIAFGANLLASAVRERQTLSWPARAVSGAPRLTGLSHGAAGGALALLELWRTTDAHEYLVAAEQAFAYERELFDPEAHNWPDLRNTTRGPSGERSFVALWCHGAPGIALSRLRACELDGNGSGAVKLAEARVALDTTRRAVEAELARGGNFSICHGLAGNAEILLQGAAALGAERSEDSALAHRVAAEGIERYAGRGLPWPCGTLEGETANLFLGLAGIGRFYLRLHEPQLPSLLLPRVEELGSRWAATAAKGSGLDIENSPSV
jgi:lantibiotic biosynthesis protein